MSRDNRNRPDSKGSTDEWLSPPGVPRELGKFDIDPCCPPAMPWRTATTMVSNGVKSKKLMAGGTVVLGDGLDPKWWDRKRRKWINPPYSSILPWAQLLAEHGNGYMLAPAKSTETAWCQLLLETADIILFQRGRFEFYLPDGTASGGAWAPSLIAAYGARNADILRAAVARGTILRGVIMKGTTKSVVTKKLTARRTP